MKIWKAGMEIAEEVFNLIENFPPEERYGLTSQMSRCSISIPSNLAEGSARSDKSFSNYIDISLGSSFELQTQIEIAFKRNYINKENYNNLDKRLNEFQKMTIVFQRNL
jgi:four helix bundle protein